MDAPWQLCWTIGRLPLHRQETWGSFWSVWNTLVPQGPVPMTIFLHSLYIKIWCTWCLPSKSQGFHNRSSEKQFSCHQQNHQYPCDPTIFLSSLDHHIAIWKTKDWWLRIPRFNQISMPTMSPLDWIIYILCFTEYNQVQQTEESIFRMFEKAMCN